MEKLNRIRTRIDVLNKELEPLWEEERDLYEALFEVRKKSQPIIEELSKYGVCVVDE